MCLVSWHRTVHLNLAVEVTDNRLSPDPSSPHVIQGDYVPVACGRDVMSAVPRVSSRVRTKASIELTGRNWIDLCNDYLGTRISVLALSPCNITATANDSGFRYHDICSLFMPSTKDSLQP